MQVTDRKLEWDFVKAFLMLIVIWGHILPALSGTKYTENWCVVTRFTGLFVMPLFFVISGYFQSNITDFKSLSLRYKKMVKRLVLPLIAWGGVYLIIRLSIDNAIFPLIRCLKLFISSLDFYWFIPCLIACIILGSVIKLLIHKNKAVGWIFLFATILSFTYLPYDFFHFSFMWVFYAIGMMLNTECHFWNLLINSRIAVYVFSIVLPIVLLLGCNFYPKETFYMTSNLMKDTNIVFLLSRFCLYISVSLTILYWLMVLYKKCANWKLVNLFALSGRDTLFLYVSHVLITSFVLKSIYTNSEIIRDFSASYTFFQYYLIDISLAILLYAALYFICSVLKKSKMCRKLLMGIN